MKIPVLKKKGNQVIAITILGFTLILGSASFAKAQNKIDTYSMSALGHQEFNNFDISISDDNTLWIDAYATYSPGEKCGLKIEGFLQPDFLYTLEKAKEQYSDWKKISVEKNIKDVRMKMDYVFATEGYFSYLNNLKYDQNVMIIFAFTYFKGEYVLIMNLEKMTASDNELVTFDGTSVIFNSEQEIESFIRKISPEAIANNKAKLNTAGL